MRHIDTVHLFVAVEANGDEGVPAFLDPATGMWMPMVAADAARLDSLRRIAQSMSLPQGTRIKLVRFTAREDLEEIKTP